ncbi:MAG: phospholipid carrier-dependent glycosyltransferase [Chloroflexi bacterium]|nr:phospholipid carrier-dependent glycosyltransferase [Chloroflexota bacterium]
MLHRYRLLDALILLLAMGYITLGTDAVPLHGDEPTTIWMSRDFHTIILEGDPGAVAYEPPPRRTTDQHMRIITTNMTKFAMGLAWYGAGYEVAQINDQWVWAEWADIEWNRSDGHMPTDELLKITRLTAAWMTALSTVFVLATTRLVARTVLAHPLAIAIAGWVAVLMYTIHPAILLNGRRAMFEGGLLLGLTAVGWIMTLLVIRHRSWGVYVLAGVLTGLALSTKHSATFTVVLLYSSVGLVAAWELIRIRSWQRLAGLALATGIALLIFWGLHPMWWSDPLAMPELTIDQRRQMLDEQVALFGGYDGPDDRLTGLWNEGLRPQPQYYEADYWANFEGVDSAIADYEASRLGGWLNGQDVVAFVLRSLLLVTGGVLVARSIFQGGPAGRKAGLLMAFWLLGIGALTLLTVPLGWQRYYLPLQPALVVTMGLGAGGLLDLWGRGTHVSF